MCVCVFASHFFFDGAVQQLEAGKLNSNLHLQTNRISKLWKIKSDMAKIVVRQHGMGMEAPMIQQIFAWTIVQSENRYSSTFTDQLVWRIYNTSILMQEHLYRLDILYDNAKGA